MSSQTLEIPERVVRQKDKVRALLKKVHPGKDIPVYLGPKTFDKNWDKGWNKDGH